MSWLATLFSEVLFLGASESSTHCTSSRSFVKPRKSCEAKRCGGLSCIAECHKTLTYFDMCLECIESWKTLQTLSLLHFPRKRFQDISGKMPHVTQVSRDHRHFNLETWVLNVSQSSIVSCHGRGERAEGPAI